MRHLLLTISATTLLGACSTIDQTSSIKQQMDKTLIAGPGDLLVRVDRERDLENALGKADIFGRKTKEGFTELRFGGVEASGEVVLLRKDVQIITNETTMSRTSISTTTGQASTSVSGNATTYGNNTRFQGSGITNYTSTTLPPTSEFHVVIPSDTVAVRLGPSEKRMLISGYVVEIVGASRNALEYRITKTP